jgi:hypothetical protein
MREQEKYWSRKGPPTPEVKDLPERTFKGDEAQWCSLSPGMRRAIWREAIHGEAKARGLSEDILFRLKIATIDGGLSLLDDYLAAFEHIDARRAAMPEDADRLKRADAIHQKGEVQIAARESL